MTTTITRPTSAATTQDVVCSEVRISKAQPRHTGHPFVIFAPHSLVVDVLGKHAGALSQRGMKVHKSQPLFLRTDLLYARLSFNYGDAATATYAYELIKKGCEGLVFKNWHP